MDVSLGDRATNSSNHGQNSHIPRRWLRSSVPKKPHLGTKCFEGHAKLRLDRRIHARGVRRIHPLQPKRPPVYRGRADVRILQHRLRLPVSPDLHGQLLPLPERVRDVRSRCEVLFVLYIVTFTYWEAQRFRQVKWKVYFSDTWNVVEVIILGLSYCVLGLFINRLIICSHLMSNFSDSDFEKFVSFYAPAFFDAVLRYVMGVLNLVTIIKFFKLLRFNVRLSTLAQTLSYAKGKLLAYCIGLIGITMAFAQFALLLFGYTLEGYRNFTATIISMFVFMLGESDYYGLLEGDAILGPAFFFLFSLTFQFIFVQYFVTLLMDAFNKAVTNLATMKTEVHMVQYIMRKLYLLIMLDTQKANQKKKRLL